MQLIITGTILFLLRLMISKFILGEDISLTGIPGALLFFTGSPVPTHPNMLIVGMVWFLAVLFEARILFDGIMFLESKVLRGILILTITISGVILGSSGFWLPFSIDIGFTCLIFLYTGKAINDFRLIERNTVLNTIISFGIWLILLFLEYQYYDNYLELACRRYLFPPLSLACAVAGSIFILFVSNLMSKKNVSRSLIFLGKNSMTLFAIHYMDRTWRIWALLPDTLKGKIIAAFVRICIDIMLLICILQLKRYIKQHITRY